MSAVDTIVINKLSWAKALELATEACRIYGIRQRVYRDPLRGWTWAAVETP
jgi:hypothetical protein